MKYLLNLFAILWDTFQTYSNFFRQNHSYTTYAYADIPARRRKLDFFPPKEQFGLSADVTSPAPVILFIHGGGWVGGSRKHIQSGILNQINRGYAMASLGYSLAFKAKWPTQIQEIKAAIRWLKAHASELGIDPDRMILWGTSAGGHLANMAGTTNNSSDFQGQFGNTEQNTAVAGTISWFGISDFLQMGKNGFWTWGFDIVAHLLLGESIYKNPEKAEKANPLRYIHAQTPPFYLAHGDRDTLSSHHQSELLHEALIAKGVSSEIQILKGMPHADVRFSQTEYFQGSQDFLDRIAGISSN